MPMAECETIKLQKHTCGTENTSSIQKRGAANDNSSRFDIDIPLAGKIFKNRFK